MQVLMDVSSLFHAFEKLQFSVSFQQRAHGKGKYQTWRLCNLEL